MRFKHSMNSGRVKGAYVKNRPKASWAGRISALTLTRIERVPCKWALNHGAILWDGSLVACGVDSEGLYTAGNVNEFTIKDMWNTTHKAFRQIHIDKRWLRPAGGLQKLPRLADHRT